VRVGSSSTRATSLGSEATSAGGFEAVYPVNEVAAKHGASVLEETSKPAEAYARFGREERSAYREGWLP
jgi:hypothetical protein